MEVVDFNSKRGETWYGLTLTLTDALSAPVDLTGSDIQMQLKSNPCESTVAFEFSTDNGLITLTDAPNGQLDITPLVIDISPRNYVYDLKITLSNGAIMFPIGGNFTILNNVTR